MESSRAAMLPRLRIFLAIAGIAFFAATAVWVESTTRWAGLGGSGRSSVWLALPLVCFGLGAAALPADVAAATVGRRTGRKGALSIAGMLAGALPLIVAGPPLFQMMSRFPRNRATEEERTVAPLRTLGTAEVTYASDAAGAYSQTLEQLGAAALIGSKPASG
jgi:hypothetical protein